MAAVVELEKYRRELDRQRGQRCTDCGARTTDRAKWGLALLCKPCEAKLLEFAAHLAVR